MENTNLSNMVLEFSVTNQTIKRLDDYRPVADSMNYLYAHFTFSDDWNGLEKYAVFTYGNQNWLQKLDDNNTCIVTFDVIKASGFYVGAKGILDRINKRVTTNGLMVQVMVATEIEGRLPSVCIIESDTLDVEQSGNVAQIEVPNIYVTDVTYDETTGKLIFKGLEGETIKSLAIPVKSIIDGNITVKKAQCDSSGNVIINYYATKTELKEVEDDLDDFKTEVASDYTTKTTTNALDQKVDGVKTYADNTFATKTTANSLQSQIDTINARADVVAVVGTKAQLDLFDKTKLTDLDIIKVLKDESKDNAQSYYQFSVSTQAFTWIGSIAESYTKAETDALISGLQTQITSNDTDISTLNSGKVTKIDTNATQYKVYTTEAGSQTSRDFSSGASKNSLALRYDNGRLKVGSAVNEEDAVNKKYLEDNNYNKTQVDALITTEVESIASGTTTYELADDKIYKIGGECLSFTPTFPSGINESYCTEVRFYSGATATEIGSGANDVFDGYDCENGDFIPMPYTRYKMIYSKGENGMTIIVARG